jgi:hypothetical protein
MNEASNQPSKQPVHPFVEVFSPSSVYLIVFHLGNRYWSIEISIFENMGNFRWGGLKTRRKEIRLNVRKDLHQLE